MKLSVPAQNPVDQGSGGGIEPTLILVPLHPPLAGFCAGVVPAVGTREKRRVDAFAPDTNDPLMLLVVNAGDLPAILEAIRALHGLTVFAAAWAEEELGEEARS